MKKIELLAPAGDIDSIKAAILAGADAIYCGLNNFNARNRATNINFSDLNGVLNLAHRNSCKVFLTLNVIIVENEIPALINLLNKLVNTSIDGVIVQDLGLLFLLSKYFKGLKIHASTQLTTHNGGQIGFLSKLGVSRVNLSRELNINEIKALARVGRQKNMKTEVFVHGSHCISFSGICYMSSVFSGKSGNRGRCGQPCRDRYIKTPEGNNYPLNLKDNSAFFDLRELYEAGVESLKIEGRIKKFDYIYTVVNCWKRQIQSLHDHNRQMNDNSDLYKVFNRDFSNSFLKGDINKDMFIDNPRDNSIQHLSEVHDFSKTTTLEQEEQNLLEEKNKIKTTVKRQIEALSIHKSPLTICISGKLDTTLEVSVHTPDTSFTVHSYIKLTSAGIHPINQQSLNKNNRKSNVQCLNQKIILTRLKALNDTECYIKTLESENLQNDLFLPFKELTSIKRKIIFVLNGSKEIIDPIAVPFLKKQNRESNKPTLSVLISSQKDLALCSNSSVNIFFQLPDCIENKYSEFIKLFSKNKRLTPWFPSVLIGKDYSAAVQLLQELHPKLIVTNNTGIAYEAYKKGISWIAGPYLNIVNSFSLLCLKEKLNCFGSFISNEISKNQIKKIVTPENFKLYYSIYHPIVLLTSRQCLFHQIIGCKKSRVDSICIQECEKSSAITNFEKGTIFIEKTKGNYNCIYNNNNYLNTNVVTDMPDFFSSFFIDLRDIKTETKVERDKSEIIKAFNNLKNGTPESQKELKKIIYPSTHTQYEKGV